MKARVDVGGLNAHAGSDLGHAASSGQARVGSIVGEWIEAYEYTQAALGLRLALATDQLTRPVG
jgi:hypothetical protein